MVSDESFEWFLLRVINGFLWKLSMVPNESYGWFLMRVMNDF